MADHNLRVGLYRVLEWKSLVLSGLIISIFIWGLRSYETFHNFRTAVASDDSSLSAYNDIAYCRNMFICCIVNAVITTVMIAATVSKMSRIILVSGIVCMAGAILTIGRKIENVIVFIPSIWLEIVCAINVFCLLLACYSLFWNRIKNRTIQV